MSRFLIIIGAAVCLPLLFVILAAVKVAVGLGIHLTLGLSRDASLIAAGLVLAAICGAMLAALVTKQGG